MRKLYLFFVMLCALMGVQTANAATFTGGTKIYLQPGSAWSAANAKFGMYVYGSSGSAWVSMSEVESGIYEGEAPSGSWSGLIFSRFDPSTTNLSFGNDWNQTKNITYDDTKNLYIITETTVSDGTGYWSTYTPITYPAVALVNNSGSSLVAYFTQDATKSWLWTLGPQTINKAVDNSDDEKYRLRLYSSASSYKDYNISSDPGNANYWISGNTTYNLASGSGNFCVQGIASAYFSVSVKDNGLYQMVVGSSDQSSKLEDLTGEEEPTDATITAIYLHKSGGNDYAFTKSSETSWTLSETTISRGSGNNYYISVEYSDGTTKKYTKQGSESATDYPWIGSGETVSLGVTTSSYFIFGAENGGDHAFTKDTVVGTLTLTDGVPTSVVFTETGGSTDGPDVDLSSVNMPLKEVDFANGKKHYFVVGTRMAEWRLQPEWELHDEDGDGVYTLDNRLVYTGKMGIAVVDSYTDYVYQRYRFYSENTFQKSGETYTIDGLSQRTNTKTVDGGTTKFTAIQYDDSNTHDQFDTEQTFRFEYTGSLGEEGIRCSTPTLVGQMALTVGNDGNPTKFEMTGITNEASAVAQYRTFSLVGGDIVYSGATWAGATPLQNESGYTTQSWQESWIQYDEYGMPYVDAYGNTIYQTVFQNEWLTNHPTIFKAADGFEYNSVNMVLSYDATQNHDKTIPADGEKAYWYNGSANEGTRTASNGWQCFVLENMWLSGEFKVWTGWGGANKKHDGSGTGTSDARWNYDNGGHEKESTDWTITAGQNIFYMTKRDINGADYSLGDDRIFVRYVKLWWDPVSGFDNSNIQLIVEDGGPQIACQRTGKNSLSYTYSVPNDPNGQLQNLYVKNLKITRYHVDTDDVVTETVVSTTDYAATEYVASNLLTAKTVNDDYYAEGGYYWYGIEVTYYANEAAGYPEAFTRDAKSNQVFIYYATIPTGVKVTQVTETGSNGETLYSFDLAIKAGAPTSLVGQKIENTDTDVLSLVEYYKVTVPKSNSEYDLYTSATAEGGATIVVESDASNYYLNVAPTGDYYQMPTITLKNVIPGDYTVKVDMVSADGDAEAWALYNVSTASATVSMVKPTAAFSATGFTVERIGEDVALKTSDETLRPYGSKGNALTYTQANKVVSTGGKFDQLMVTNSVLEDWEVKYQVTLSYTDPTDKEADGAKTFKYYSAFNDFNQAAKAVALNSGDLTATVEYLPLSTATAGETFTAGTLNITRPSDGYEMKATTEVYYTRRASDEGGKSSDMIQADTKETTATVAPSNVFAAYSDPTWSAKSYQVWGGWNGSEINYYYDAFACLTIDVDDAETLYKVPGFYAKNTTWAVAPTHYCTKSHAEGGTAIGEGADYSDTYDLDGYDPTDATKSYAAAASAAGKLPFMVHYAGTAASENEADPSNKIGTMHVVLTADYPIEVKAQPTLTASMETATYAVTTMTFSNVTAESSTNGATLQVVQIPTTTNESFVGATTDIETVAADDAAGLRIYPNPAVDVVTVAGSSALGTVEIYSLDGRLVKVVEATDYSTTVEVGDLAKGSYVVRAGGRTERMIKM